MKNSLIGPLLTDQNRKVIERAINALINLRITVTGGGASSVSRSASGENSHSVSIDIQPVVNACIENAGIRPQVTTATLNASADYTIALSDTPQIHLVSLIGASVDINNLLFTGYAPGRKATVIVSTNSGSGNSINNFSSYVWPQSSSTPTANVLTVRPMYLEFLSTTSDISGMIALKHYYS